MEFIYYGILAFFFIAWFYMRSVRRNYAEMSDRASLFAKGADLLRAEKIALLENLEEGALTVDGAGRISYMNAKAMMLIGISQDKILGKEYRELDKAILKEVATVSKKLIEKVLIEKERVHSHVVLNEVLKSHFELIAIPIPKAEGVILLLKDCSNEQKILEVGKEFIANASHELRTPVTIIRGFAETLKDLKEVSEGMYETILEKIIRNCERMESLVKNLLTLADLENSGPLNLVPCDLIAILDECAQQILSLHPDALIEQFYNQEEISILGEETLLSLAFLNILKNCVKYSHKPVSIKVIIEAREDEVYLQIEDKGVGIPKESWERIFDRFYTVDKTHSRRLGGAGIGLSIVKIIMEKHDAKIWVTSTPGEGTTFHMSFIRF
jgi:signal transduction histidine kinase